jgi:hypothetical protein
VIRVEINMHGNLRRFLPDGVASIQLDLPEGTTVLKVIDDLRAEDEVWLLAAVLKTALIQSHTREFDSAHGHHIDITRQFAFLEGRSKAYF